MLSPSLHWKEEEEAEVVDALAERWIAIRSLQQTHVVAVFIAGGEVHKERERHDTTLPGSALRTKMGRNEASCV